jgi:hypothetical protein
LLLRLASRALLLAFLGVRALSLPVAGLAAVPAGDRLLGGIRVAAVALLAALLLLLLAATLLAASLLVSSLLATTVCLAAAGGPELPLLLCVTSTATASACLGLTDTVSVALRANQETTLSSSLM